MAFVKKSITKLHYETTLVNVVNILNSFTKDHYPFTFSKYDDGSGHVMVMVDGYTNGNSSYISYSEFYDIGWDTALNVDIIKFDNGFILYIASKHNGTLVNNLTTFFVKLSDTEGYIRSVGLTKNIYESLCPNNTSTVWAYSVTNPDGYVAFAPLISVSSNLASGVTADGIYFVSGISPTSWTKDGLVINGHTFYGAYNLCICTD